MSRRGVPEEGLLGWLRLSVGLFLAGFLPPFLIVWLLTSRSRNQLLQAELGEVPERTWLDHLEVIVYAASVGLVWVLGLVAVLLVIRGLTRVSDARALAQRRAADRALARESELPEDAWGEARLRRRSAPDESQGDAPAAGSEA